MMNRCSLLLLLACFAGVSPTTGGELPAWEIDTATSSIRFQAKLWGGKIRGSFKHFEADIRLDPEQLAQSGIVATIDTASVDTRNSERDEELREENWFSIVKFPAATFESTEVRRTGEGYEARGWLTVLGVRKEVRFPFMLTMTEAANGKLKAALSGETMLKRTDFGIGKGKWGKTDVVGDEVIIRVEVNAFAPTK